ncbi:MAG: hypothetical protein HKN91_11745 [Acidimicrobiia bacterium]|nr:hypothetical protein [Acidimicrobiia bacterium]
MHQHDQDLIMALAEGSLDEEAATAARAEVEACRECARDLELQTFAFEALHSMPDAHLTEFESAGLRRNLRNELGVFKEEIQFEPSKKRRRFPIAAFGTAAAVLIAVVAIAPRLSLVGGGDSADTVALESAPATTAAAQFDAQAGLPEGGAEDNLATAAPATTNAPLAASTTTPPPPESVRDLLGYYAENPDLTLLRSRLEAQEFEPESARLYALKDSGLEVAEEDVNTVNNCLVLTLTNSEEFVEGFQFARGNYDDREVIFYVYLAEEPAASAVLVQAADTCEELARAGP